MFIRLLVNLKIFSIVFKLVSPFLASRDLSRIKFADSNRNSGRSVRADHLWALPEGVETDREETCGSLDFL